MSAAGRMRAARDARYAPAIARFGDRLALGSVITDAVGAGASPGRSPTAHADARIADAAAIRMSSERSRRRACRTRTGSLHPILARSGVDSPTADATAAGTATAAAGAGATRTAAASG